MLRLQTSTTRPYTLFPYSTLFRSLVGLVDEVSHLVVHSPHQDLAERVRRRGAHEALAVGLLAENGVGGLEQPAPHDLLPVQLEAAGAEGVLIELEPVVSGIAVGKDAEAEAVEHRPAAPVRDLAAGLGGVGREAVDRLYHPPVEPVDVAAELAQFGKHRLADGHELECCMSPLGAPLDRLLRERGDLGAALVDLRAAVTVAIVHPSREEIGRAPG